jgi:hypothetical protein
MADPQDPFADVLPIEGGFSIPELKWRELLFVGAMRPERGGFVREPARPLPPFRQEGLFPEGVVFRAEREGGRIVLRPVSGAPGAPDL